MVGPVGRSRSGGGTPHPLTGVEAFLVRRKGWRRLRSCSQERIEICGMTPGWVEAGRSGAKRVVLDKGDEGQRRPAQTVLHTIRALAYRLTALWLKFAPVALGSPSSPCPDFLSPSPHSLRSPPPGRCTSPRFGQSVAERLLLRPGPALHAPGSNLVHADVPPSARLQPMLTADGPSTSARPCPRRPATHRPISCRQSTPPLRHNTRPG